MDFSTREACVLAAARALLAEHAAGSDHLALLTSGLDDLVRKVSGAGSGVRLPAIHLPILTHAAVSGDPEPAVPLAAALTLLYAGLDLLDDMMDGDLAPEWRAYHRGEILLAASTLVSALPQLVLARLSAPAPARLALLECLARTGMIMSGGQQQDLRTTGRAGISVSEAEATAMGKSGEFGAALAALGARLAGAKERTVERYAEFGRAIAVVNQLRSDLADVLFAPHSRDLSHGTRTLPLVLWLDHYAGDERRRLEALLIDATQRKEVHQEIRDRLITDNVVSSCALIAEYYCAGARSELEQAGAREPARTELLDMVDRASILPAIP